MSSNILCSTVNCALLIYSHRIESYSCKMTGNDKRLFKNIMVEMDGGSGPNDLHALSPPESVLSRSPSRYCILESH